MNARTLATKLHAGQVDLIGEPYERHINTVADFVQAAGGTTLQVEAAYLHDTIEDTEATADFLIANGINEEAVVLVRVLTHYDNEPYAAYLDRICAVPDAVLIKLADIYDNLNPARMARLEPAKRERLLIKYGKALMRLGEGATP